jgi:hypothetical protein
MNINEAGTISQRVWGPKTNAVATGTATAATIDASRVEGVAAVARAGGVTSAWVSGTAHPRAGASRGGSPCPLDVEASSKTLIDTLWI